MGNRIMATFICEYCGKEFTKRKDLKPRYCSSQCYGKAKSIQERKYVECPVCGAMFYKRRSEQLYCSKKCSGEAHKKRILIQCDFCGKEFERNECHIQEHNFCSRSCLNEWHKDNRIGNSSPRWGGGVHIQDGYLFLRQDDGSYKAEHRIIMEKELGRELNSDEIVHHIDENKKNNSIDNLVVLTRAEHAKIHHTKNA